MMHAAAAAIEQAGRGRNRSRYLEQRRRFCEVLVRIGGNAELDRVLPLSRTDLFRAQMEGIQTEAQHRRHAAGYGRIAQAVIDEKPAEADAAVKRHFAGTRKTMDELPPEAFASAVL